MRIEVRNQAAAFMEWWDAAQVLDPADRARSWFDRIERPNYDIYARYFPRFGKRADLADALRRLDNDVERIRTPLTALPASLTAYAERVGAVFGDPHGAVTSAVIMVGLYGSNAWTLDGDASPVSYFALERLPAHPAVRDALLTHELAHAAHRLVRPGRWAHGIRAKLVEETLAIATSSLLVHGLDDVAYASFGDQSLRWVESCKSQLDEIVDVAFREDSATEMERYEKLFARQPRASEIPRRCGYYLARVLAADLTASSVKVTARMEPDQATASIASR